MFRVEAHSLREYLDFDPGRKADLVKFGALIRTCAPNLERHFHQGTPAGSAGMRMKMIGYGQFRYTARSGEQVSWPVIGVALQKNYISVYVSVTRDAQPVVQRYAGRLGEVRSARNNFSFEKFEQLDTGVVSKLITEAARILARDPQNPVRYW